MRGVRALAVFWGALLAVAGMGGGVLQWLGPPRAVAAKTELPDEVHAHPAEPTAKPETAPPAGAPTEATPEPTRLSIAPPDKALQEASADFAGGFLPKIGTDHRTPMTVYAAAAAADPHPKVAILLAGIGMSLSDSEAAIAGTPPAVSLAVSPYSLTPEPLLDSSRARGHEYFLSVPMEPAGFPLDDPGNRALLTGNARGLNEQDLAWAMTRFAGYVGATGALGSLHGERFSDSPAQIGPVLTELGKRGVMYIDPRPGATVPQGTVGRAVDVVIDVIPGASDIDAALGKLEDVAIQQGSALGLVSLPRPVALARINAWTEGLAQRGVVLTPVSAVAQLAPRTREAAP